jgi:hypothetical protein
MPLKPANTFFLQKISQQVALHHLVHCKKQEPEVLGTSFNDGATDEETRAEALF